MELIIAILLGSLVLNFQQEIINIPDAGGIGTNPDTALFIGHLDTSCACSQWWAASHSDTWKEVLHW